MKPWEKYSAGVESGPAAPWEKYSANIAPPTPPPAKQTRRGLREQSTLAERMSATAGFPILAESDLSAGVRADLGLSDKFEERRSKFKSKFPGSVYEQIPTKTGMRDVYRRSPDEPGRMVDPPGFDWKDLIDSPRDVATMAAQGAIAALAPPSLLAQLGLQAGASGLMHLGKEGIEEMRGFQQQPLGEVLGEAGLQTGADLAMGAIPATVARLARGPKAELSETIVNDFNAIEQLRQMQPSLEQPMAHQIRPDNLILGRLAAQAGSTSAAMKGAFEKQQMSFADLMNTATDASIGEAGRVLTSQARPAMTRAKNQLMSDFKLNNEEAGKAIKGVFDTSTDDGFYRKSRQEINAAYDEAGRFAQGVEFDLAGAQAAAKEVTAPVEATATDWVDSALVDMKGQPLGQMEVRNFVNVAASRGDKVNRVAKLLATIDPEQGNWEVLKELRSQVGDVIAKSPEAEDAVSGAAKRIYSELTRSMENPINANPQFVTSWQKANGLARRRFQVYEQGRVLKTLKEDSPSAVAKMFINDPDQLTPIVREVIDQYAPGKRDVIRKGIQSGLLESPNSVDAIRKWESIGQGNENAYNWLFKNKTDRQKFVEAAESMDQLRAAPLGKLVNYSGSQIDAGKKLLEGIGPAELEKTIRLYGGRGSKAHDAMRLAAIDEIIQKNIQSTKDGMPTVSSGGLTNTIREMQRRGIWDKLLTKEDRVRIKGMDAYVRRVFKSLSDTGTSLEQAQAIAALKHPSTFLQGFHALFVNNRVLAPLLMSKKTARLFKPKTRTRGPARKDAWFIFAANAARDLAQLATELDSDELQ